MDLAGLARKTGGGTASERVPDSPSAAIERDRDVPAVLDGKPPAKHAEGYARATLDRTPSIAVGQHPF